MILHELMNLFLGSHRLMPSCVHLVYYYYYYYYYYYLLQIGFHSVLVVLTLVTNKNKYT